MVIAFGSDPYGSFRARYVPFAREMLAPFDAATLEDRGSDMTSLLYPIRDQIVAKLSTKRSLSKFDASNVRLSIRLGKSAWLVDQKGVVLHEGSSSSLAPADFRDLREMILQRIPSTALEQEDVERSPQ